MAIPASEHYMALVGMVALLTAGLLFVARIFRLGFLADFLSRTVLVGFLTGVVIAGVHCHAQRHVPASARLRAIPWAAVWQVIQGLSHPHVPTLSLAVAVTTAVLLGNRFARRLPIALLAVLGTIGASAAFDFAHQGIALIGPVPGGLPLFKLPQVTWAEILAVLPISASCFVMIIAQSADNVSRLCPSISGVCGLRRRHSRPGSGKRCGLLERCTGGSTGSPTQTAMAERMGARSQVAQLTLAVVVDHGADFLHCAAPIPATLRTCRHRVHHRSRHDRRFSTAIHPARKPRRIRARCNNDRHGGGTGCRTGHFAGHRPLPVSPCPTQLSAAYHGLDARRENGTWVPAPAVPGCTTTADLIVYRFGADLFYANANRFADEVHALVQCAPSPIRWFVVDCAAITDLDYSAALSIRDLLAELDRRHIVVVFGRVNPYLRSDMDRHCISPVVGDSGFFPRCTRRLRWRTARCPRLPSAPSGGIGCRAKRRAALRNADTLPQRSKSRDCRKPSRRSESNAAR